MIRIAIPIFDGFTALDAIGPYEVLSRLPGAEVVFLGERAGLYTTDTGMVGLSAKTAFAELPDPEIVLVPGGPGVRSLLTAGPLLDWVRRADSSSTWTTSVCTGSLLLGAAGLLAGRQATCHWLELDALDRFGATPRSQRVVRDGKLITAAGVSAGIDMGLALAAEIAGERTAMTIQLAIEYDPQPPFESGSPRCASADAIDAVKAAAAARNRARSQES